MRKYSTLSLAIFIFIFICYNKSNGQDLKMKSQCFEGYLVDSCINTNGVIDMIPIWCELNIPSEDGKFTGLYFYKKRGEVIPLAGEKKGEQITLTEKNSKGVVTGTFIFKLEVDRLLGKWRSAVGKKQFEAILYAVNAEEKKYAIIPKPDKLQLLGGTYLSQELNDNLQTDGKGKETIPRVKIIVSEKGIVSLQYTITTGSMGQFYESIFHNFTIGASNSEIVLKNEIANTSLNDFKAIVKKYLQIVLDKNKPTNPDDMKQAADCFSLESANSDQISSADSLAIMARYTANDESINRILNTFYLTRNSLVIVINGYLDVITPCRSMDIHDELSIPFTEIRKYFANGSNLQKFATR